MQGTPPASQLVECRLNRPYRRRYHSNLEDKSLKHGGTVLLDIALQTAGARCVCVVSVAMV